MEGNARHVGTESMLPQNHDGRGSSRSAFFNFFKSNFGAGVLAMPHAFTWAGVVGGCVVYAVAVVLCVCSQLMLLKCKHHAQARCREGALVSSYPSLVGHVFGPAGYRITAVMVIVTQLAFCTGWVIIVVDNLAITTQWATTQTFSLLAFPLLLLLSSVRWLADLWVLSLLGLLAYCVGVMGSSYYYILAGDLHYDPVDAGVVHWGTLPKFAGTAMHGLEAILMVLPVEDSMAKPQHAPWVIFFGLTIYALFSVVFGTVGYMYGLGDCVKDSGAVVTDCLPSGALTTVVRLSLASAILLSFPVILFPVSEIAEEILFPSQQTSAVRRTLLGCVEVFLTCIIACLCPNFSIFSDIVGTLMVPIVGFVLPSVLYLKLLPQEDKKISDMIVEVILLACGPLLLVLGVYSLLKHS